MPIIGQPLTAVTRKSAIASARAGARSPGRRSPVEIGTDRLTVMTHMSGDRADRPPLRSQRLRFPAVLPMSTSGRAGLRRLAALDKPQPRRGFVTSRNSDGVSPSGEVDLAGVGRFKRAVAPSPRRGRGRPPPHPLPPPSPPSAASSGSWPCAACRVRICASVLSPPGGPQLFGYVAGHPRSGGPGRGPPGVRAGGSGILLSLPSPLPSPVLTLPPRSRFTLQPSRFGPYRHPHQQLSPWLRARPLPHCGTPTVVVPARGAGSGGALLRRRPPPCLAPVRRGKVGCRGLLGDHQVAFAYPILHIPFIPGRWHGRSGRPHRLATDVVPWAPSSNSRLAALGRPHSWPPQRLTSASMASVVSARSFRRRTPPPTPNTPPPPPSSTFTRSPRRRHNSLPYGFLVPPPGSSPPLPAPPRAQRCFPLLISSSPPPRVVVGPPSSPLPLSLSSPPAPVFFVPGSAFYSHLS